MFDKTTLVDYLILAFEQAQGLHNSGDQTAMRAKGDIARAIAKINPQKGIEYLNKVAHVGAGVETRIAAATDTPQAARFGTTPPTDQFQTALQKKRVAPLVSEQPAERKSPAEEASSAAGNARLIALRAIKAKQAAPKQKVIEEIKENPNAAFGTNVNGAEEETEQVKAQTVSAEKAPQAPSKEPVQGDKDYIFKSLSEKRAYEKSLLPATTIDTELDEGYGDMTAEEIIAGQERLERATQAGLVETHSSDTEQEIVSLTVQKIVSKYKEGLDNFIEHYGLSDQLPDTPNGMQKASILKKHLKKKLGLN